MQKEKNNTINDKPKKLKIGTVKKQDTSDVRANYVYLSIGSNLGNRIHFLERSKYLMETHDIKIIKTSSYYETESWPNPSFPKFINAVLLIETKLNQVELFKMIKFIEKKLGRKVAPQNHPRNCDIDILDFSGKIIKSKKNTINLEIPHPRMHNRNFVLMPLFEICKNWSHPKLKKSIVKLLSSLKKNNLRSIKVI